MSRSVKRAAGDRRHSAEAYARWLRVGAVAVGLGAAITSGQGVATATPSDAPDPGPTTTTTSETSDADNDGVGTESDVDGESPADVEQQPGLPGSALPDPTSTEPNADVDIDIDAVGDESGGDATTGAGAEQTAEEPTDDGVDGQPADRTRKSGDPAALDSTDPSDRSVTGDEGDETVQPGDGAVRAHLFTSLSLADTAADLTAQSASVFSSPIDLAAVATPPATPATPAPVAVSQPEAAAEVTFTSIITDVLGWLGLQPLATGGLPMNVPVPWLVESLWLAVRQNNDKFAGQQPAAQTTTAAAARDAGVDPIDLAELDRPGVDVHLNTDGTVDVIDGAFSDIVVTSDADAAHLLNALAPLLGASSGFAGSDNITVQHAGTESFYRLSDKVNGVSVVGSEVILVTDANGNVTGLFNNHNRHLDGIDVTPDARIDDPREIVRVPGAALLDSAAGPGAGWLARAFSSFDRELVIYAPDENATPQLAWAVVARPSIPLGLAGLADGPTSNSVYLIDATGADAGSVIMRTAGAPADIPFTTPETTIARDVRGVNRTIDFSRLSLGSFNLDILSDQQRDITTYLTPFLLLLRGIPVFGPLSGLPIGPFSWNTSAVAAHANMALVHDYYLDTLDRDSYDGKGAPIRVIIEFNPFLGLFGEYGNAFWDPFDGQLVFGDGGDKEGALDTTGHEFTHGVFGSVVMNGNPVVQLLNYNGESGSLSEAYSDVMGGFIEGKDVTSNARWTEGEDSSSGANRDMKTPGNFGDPDDYANRYTGDEDRGGVHTNSTIFSHATYLMMMDYAVTADIEQKVWADVFYKSMFRLSPGATFVDARAAVINSANAAGFDQDEMNAVVDAFDRVGIE